MLKWGHGQISAIQEQGMKHFFIMNPAAGKGKAGEVCLPRIIATSKRLKIDYEIHRTIAPGDAAHFVRANCEERKKKRTSEEIYRFYACGGDGTLNEVANGAYGYEHAEIAMIPAGTGNDFPRNFRNLKFFEDIERQIKGEAKWIDLIRCETSEQASDPYLCDEKMVWYGINMFNIGLDSNVADKVAQIKNYSLVPGFMAYGMGVAIALGRKDGVNLEITLDDGEAFAGDMTLVAIANGCYCGGGFKGMPEADIEDGLIDVSIIADVSRRTFLSLLSKYRKGTHLEDPTAAKYISYRKCRSLTIHSEDPVKLCTDGEISIAGGIKFEIVPKSIKFSVPQGCV
jgi:diacylglycerol kinase (ATP)